VQHDPAVQSVVGFTGQGSGGAAGQTNTGRVYVALKPVAQRDGVDAVMTRLRRKLASVAGARLYLIPIQDISTGARKSNAAYQYTLEADSTA
jgi:multidrug efflux pump